VGTFEIPAYHAYLSPALTRSLFEKVRQVAGIEGLVEVGTGGGLETPEALRFLVELYEAVKPELARVLGQRVVDRKFIDERTNACFRLNRELGRGISESDYKTVLGLEDGKGRIVFGPRTENYNRPVGKKIAPLPDYLKGPHVTLFGPPDSAKLSINAMNAYHRKLPGEPTIVGELLATSSVSPMWGADDEDSKTPLRADLVEAGVNLTACFDGTIVVSEGPKKYELASDHLSLPIKRFPGIAIPCSFLFYGGSPVPLHLYDFALHLFRNVMNPRALVFYVPKLENEEEAAYIHTMIETAERLIGKLHSKYVPGTIRLMIVLENPRAILRANEIMDALHPYFAGASLGWHDYLASTARLFKEDGNYRIPVKADPNIVIKYIQASHRVLAEVVGSRGGIKVGGMYGILPIANDPTSLQITLLGYFKDVITQLKRELTGFWVAHPDFVRLGLAVVEAWKLRKAGAPGALRTLVTSFLDPSFHADILAFIEADDLKGLDPSDPGYVRSLIVADISESDFIANNHPDEIRYNVFQSLQYLADWLSGNGCVALPTTIGGVNVRVMDDLATAERSRWEVWHELRHGRFEVEKFLKIAHEEMNFIRRELSNAVKIVQVKWDDRTAKWYPIAFELMLQLMTDPNPAEFATELLLPFTVEEVRAAPDPWKKIKEIDPEKFRLAPYVKAFHHFFEICGVEKFARTMALNPIEDRKLAEKVILSFSREEVIQAGEFHGDIGQSRKTLDARAASEQGKALNADDAILVELRRLGEDYRAKYGIKFLISAKGKSGDEILQELKRRSGESSESELNSARQALVEISLGRMGESSILGEIEALRLKYGIVGSAIALNTAEGSTQVLVSGEQIKGKARVEADTAFEIASLSKTIGSAFAFEYFRKNEIPLETSVNAIFGKTKSKFRLRSLKNPAWADRVTLEHLMNHSAGNLHYVKGFALDKPFPKLVDLLEGGQGYDPFEVIHEPGTRFQYSGGGFMVLEYLITELEGKPLEELTLDLGFFSSSKLCAHGYLDTGEEVEGTRLRFPAFAAGGVGSAGEMAAFLRALTQAYHSLECAPGISHETAVRMLHGTDLGCLEFMGCKMGLGVFVAEAGNNRLAIHQGANDGFRALYIQCFAGPDRGKGIVVFCNASNQGVLFIAEVARKLLKVLEISGMNLEKVSEDFSFTNLAQEEIVNLGYKNLIFNAFEPDLPEVIAVKGERGPLAEHNLVIGAKTVSVTDQKFARAENLVSPFLPVFDPELFGRQGKIMDSWETVRHNPLTCDTLDIALERASIVRFVSLSTKFHDGNHPQFVRVLGLDPTKKWIEVFPKTAMIGHGLLQAELETATPEISRVRVEIYPDGGLSRLGLFSELPEPVKRDFSKRAAPVRFSDEIPKSKKPLSIPYRADSSETQANLKRVNRPDYASLAFGGSVTRASNEHYSPASQIISPYPPIHMFDGLESARSRVPGHSEEVELKLGSRIRIQGVVLDFTYFVNNNPVAVSIEGMHGKTWVEIVAKTPVKAFAANQLELRVRNPEVFQDIRVRIFPDGGINRIKVFGSAFLG
jgi:malate synthase